jgi:glycosyltransferase involved in cell wall biosynthesis
VKLALVHDYLNQRGGAERVFAQFVSAWPEAPVYTALYDEMLMGDLVPRERVHASFLARLPGANRHFRYLAPLYPRAFESFDLSEFDVILSSTSAWAKGVRFRDDAVHVCFIHTVSRFLFDYDRYLTGLREAQGDKTPGWVVRAAVDRLAAWDLEASKRPTQYVANSRTVAKRVKTFYGRDAEVLHSPVDVDRFTIGSGSGDYFLVVSRLLPYKRVDLAIDAARIAGVKLLVAGTGPSEHLLRQHAQNTAATLLGYVADDQMNELIGNARAVILPGEEDLGLVPIEAAAAGRPAIAFRAGGAIETVIEGVTGEFFDLATPEALATQLRTFDPGAYDAKRLRAHAERFSVPLFMQRLREIIERVRSGASAAPA